MIVKKNEEKEKEEEDTDIEISENPRKLTAAMFYDHLFDADEDDEDEELNDMTGPHRQLSHRLFLLQTNKTMNKFSFCRNCSRFTSSITSNFISLFSYSRQKTKKDKSENL